MIFYTTWITDEPCGFETLRNLPEPIWQLSLVDIPRLFLVIFGDSSVSTYRVEI